MNIVALDGYTLNPGDLSWGALETDNTSFKVYERSTRQETLERAAKAEVLLTNKTVLDREIIESLPDLKYIGVLATGFNIVDVDAARERGIPVTNVPGYGTEAVAQHVFALILALARRVEHHAQRVRTNGWATSDDFCFWETDQIDLEKKNLGILGFGNIGRAVARIGSAFRMNILIHSRSHPRNLSSAYEFVDLNTLLTRSDILSLHCPLTEDTHYLMNQNAFERMRKGAFLINTGRGPLVHEGDLADALKDGEIAGAGIDVMEAEPPPPDHALYQIDTCLITPHLAWATQRARQRLLSVVIDNLTAWLAGQPQNVVNSVSS